MAHVLVHSCAIDDLAAGGSELPGEIRAALDRHLVYARFGALLPDLPQFTDFTRQAAARLAHKPPTRAPFATLFHNGAPVALGLKLCELVSRASFVGRGPGLAVVAGYFSHVAVDRALQAPVHELVRRAGLVGEHPRETLRRVETLQALFHMRRVVGRDVAGWHGVIERLRIQKRRGFPFRGVGRGLHLLVHRACLDTLGPAPKKRDLDRWVQGLYVYARFLGSPAGRLMGLPEDAAGLRPVVYRGPDLDFEKLYQAAVDRATHHVCRAFEYLAEGDFSRGARDHFFSDVPEGAIA
jgi:hypothetical protein